MSHREELLKLEAAIARVLFDDLRRPQGDPMRQMAVLTILTAKMLCALASTEGCSDESLLAAHDLALRDAVCAIRERESRRGAAPPARTH